MKWLIVIWIFLHAKVTGKTVKKNVLHKRTEVFFSFPHSKRTVVSSPASSPGGDSDDENQDKAKHLIFDMSLAQIASRYNMKHLQDLIARTKIEGNDESKNIKGEDKAEEDKAEGDEAVANSTTINLNKVSAKLISSREAEESRNSTNSSTTNDTARSSSADISKEAEFSVNASNKNSNRSETTATRRGKTASEALCENCLNNCSDLARSVTSLPDLSSLPLESKVLPHLLSCYYGDNNNKNTSVEDLHTAALLDERDDVAGHGDDGRRRTADEGDARKRTIQKSSILTNDQTGITSEPTIKKAVGTETSEKSAESKVNRSSRGKSNRSISKSNRSTIRSKSHHSTIEKKDSVNSASIIAALSPLKEREGYMNILSNVDALLKNPSQQKREEEPGADEEEANEGKEKVREDDQEVETRKPDKSPDQRVDERDWNDSKKERNENDELSNNNGERKKVHDDDDVKSNEGSVIHNGKRLGKSHAEDYINEREDEETDDSEGSGSSSSDLSTSPHHKHEETDKEDGAAFFNGRRAEAADKRHSRGNHDIKGANHRDNPISGRNEENDSQELENSSSKKSSTTGKDRSIDRGEKVDNFRRQFPSEKQMKNNEKNRNKENNRNEDAAQAVTKQSIARATTGEASENTNILTAQLNTQITDLENKLIQQKLAEELKQFTAEQNPPSTTGPSTSEILNFEKNLEKSFEYDPELRNLERGRGGRSHDYLVFNGGHTGSRKGEKDAGLYDELRKSGEEIDKYEKETTAKLLKMYSPKLTKDISLSKFDSDDYRSKSVDSEPSKLEGADRIDLYEKDESKLIDKSPPNVASNILEKDRAQLVAAFGTGDQLTEAGGEKAHESNRIEPETHNSVMGTRILNPVENALHREYISPNMKLQGNYDDKNQPVELLEQYNRAPDISNTLPSKTRVQEANHMMDNSHSLLEKYTNPDESTGEELANNLKDINQVTKERFTQKSINRNHPMMNSQSIASSEMGKDFSEYIGNGDDYAPLTRTGASTPSFGETSSSSSSSSSSAAFRTPVSPVPTFSYDPNSPLGPDSWQRINRDWTCKGRKQSPINIATDSISSQELIRNIMLRNTQKNGPTAITGLLKNNGHAPTVTLSSGSNGVKLFGGTLNGNYFLKQLHFHFGCNSSVGSEHRINGKAYPVELHLVFWDNSTYSSFSEAAKSDRGVAVIAVLYALAPRSTVKESPLSQISKILRHVENQGDSMQIFPEDDIRLEDLVPNLMSSDHAGKFYTYEGSLSSPGCYETVTWIVIASQPPVTEEQLRAFRTLKSSVSNKTRNMCNNFRPVQRINGRKVYSNII